jgi:hypothetical protein
MIRPALTEIGIFLIPFAFYGPAHVENGKLVRRAEK